MANKTELPPVTTLTEGDYNGLPTLALPTKNAARPIVMTIGKWRVIQQAWPQVEAWLEKNKNFCTTKKIHVNVDARRQALMAELASLVETERK